MFTKIDVLRGILIGKGMIWAPAKGLVGGGGRWGRATMEKMWVKYIYICRQKYIGKLIIAIMIEILTKIPKNLGGASPVLGVRCEWIATAALLAGGVASSLFGGAKARREAKKAERERKYRAAAEKAWYDKEYNTDYIDTKAGQNLMRRAQEVQDSYIRKADGAAAVGGGTAAATAMAKEAANKTMGDTIANIGAKDTARKQQVADAHFQHQIGQSQEREQAAMQTAQNTSEAAQNMSNALFKAGVTQLGSEPKVAKSLNDSLKPSDMGSRDNTGITSALGESADARLKKVTEGVDGLFG